jgi:hypothetical protein
MKNVLDASIEPAKGKSANEKTIFINDVGSNPAITWSNNKNHLFISCQQEVLKIGNYFGIQSDMLETGGSVATSAFSFSYMAGANPIILIGQDLAFTNNKDHAEDYINPFGDELIVSKINSGYTTKGYYGEDVSTDKQFLMYKSWYERKFVQINAQTGHARAMHTTPSMHIYANVYLQ